MEERMKTKGLVLFLLVTLVSMATWATIPQPSASICSDNFAWMASSSTSPNTSPCETWTPATSNPSWNWMPTYVNGSYAWFMPDPTTAVTSTLQIGDGSQQFFVTNMSVAFLQANGANEYKHDGWIVEISPDLGTTWLEFTTVGGILTPTYNATMVGSVWSGISKAYSGTMTSTKIRVDLRESTLVGSNVIFRIRFISDLSVGLSGVWLTNFEYWDAPLDAPTNVIGSYDNSSIYVDWSVTPDPRIISTEVFDNGVSMGTPTSPLQVNGLVNGSFHSIEIRNSDSYGNVASVTTSVLTPTCTGKPPMTLLLVSKSAGTDVKGSWIAQTAEVPCGTGVGLVDGYLIYQALSPNGPWSLVASGGNTMLAFFDPGALLNNTLYFYRVVSNKNGVSEPVPENPQIPISN